jgi:hypothetical protein
MRDIPVINDDPLIRFSRLGHDPSFTEGKGIRPVAG